MKQRIVWSVIGLKKTKNDKRQKSVVFSQKLVYHFAICHLYSFVSFTDLRRI